MLGIRQKLSLGFGGLLVIILIIGFQSIVLLTELGDSIDVILRENYRSVIACQEMKEALERIDSGILFVLLGYEPKGLGLLTQNETVFRKALKVELNNITLPGEGDKASGYKQLFKQYKAALEDTTNPALGSRFEARHIFLSAPAIVRTNKSYRRRNLAHESTKYE